MRYGAHAFSIVASIFPIDTQIVSTVIKRHMALTGKLPFCQHSAHSLREVVHHVCRSAKNWPIRFRRRLGLRQRILSIQQGLTALDEVKSPPQAISNLNYFVQAILAGADIGSHPLEVRLDTLQLAPELFQRF